MLKLSLLLCGVFFIGQVTAKGNDKDPFSNMSFHKLKNGMNVVLAPNQGSKNIRVKLIVGFGRLAETKDNLQAGHVLEHMLFKDGSIDDHKSYLEVIKEAGGDVNAYVTNDHTAYHTTITADKGEWLLAKFKKMLFSRELTQAELDLGKASVELEIGNPFFVNSWFGANPFGYFLSNYFPYKDFQEIEFGIKPFPYSREDERLSVKKLKLSAVKNIYKDYYYPSNMTLIVAGKFNPVRLNKLIDSELGNIERTLGKSRPVLKASTRGNMYYKESPSVGGGKASIAYGTKLYKRSADEILALDAYMEYVAHRLMIELRNKKGETYTAYSVTDYRNDAGYSYVSFQTPSEKYEKNRKYLIDLIQKEAVQGKISDEVIKEAISLHLKNRYEIQDNDAEGLTSLAELYLELKEDFKVDQSPYQVLSSMTPKTFRNNLMLVFATEKTYRWENLPPLICRS